MKATVKKLRENFHYDAQTGLIWWKKRGLGRRFDKPCGSITPPKNYVHIEFEGRIYKAHHLVWALVTGRWAKTLDHKDRNPANNRFDNLREATSSQQMANRRRFSNNSSGFRGVHGRHGRWRAVLQYQKKRIHLGYFHSPAAASEAYQEAAKIHFGEFAD